MSNRVAISVALSLSLVSLAACTQDVPTDIQTVQLAVIAGSDHGGMPISESMTQEVTNTPVYAGDPDGTGSALLTINAGQGEVCWETSVANLATATASHIHHAEAGIRGPIVVVLSPPDASGAAQGCRTGVDRALLRDILQHPEAYYVNVHTTEFPSGAIRGQFGH